MLDTMPVFAEFFHMQPSEFWALTFAELAAFERRLEVVQSQLEAAG